MTGHASQSSCDVRFEWGLEGLRAVAGDDPLAIVVDVLSFSTSVSVALSRNAAVLPFRWGDDRAVEYAGSQRALLAGRRSGTPGSFSLSPASLLDLDARTRIVLPSLNGSSICFDAPCSHLMTGSLRNRTPVVELASSLNRPIAVIAAGERWPDGSLRPALEDLLGAGAIISRLEGTRSPEAQMAVTAFAGTLDVGATLCECSSGRELRDRGFAADVALASELDVDPHAALLRDGAFAPALRSPSKSL